MLIRNFLSIYFFFTLYKNRFTERFAVCKDIFATNRKKGEKMQKLIPIDDIRVALQDRRLTVVAERCGLSHPTVKSIATGNEQISLTTWKKLSEYLSEAE